MEPWEKKVHEVIQSLCWDSYKAANPKPLRVGRQAKPYHIPAVAQALVTALGLHDIQESEEQCKRILLQYGHLPFDAKF